MSAIEVTTQAQLDKALTVIGEVDQDGNEVAA